MLVAIFKGVVVYCVVSNCTTQQEFGCITLEHDELTK